jgi:hypothetical protein
MALRADQLDRAVSPPLERAETPLDDSSVSCGLGHPASTPAD